MKKSSEAPAIQYTIATSTLGNVLVAASPEGICAVTLGEDPKKLLRDVQKRFPKADLLEADTAMKRYAAKVVALIEHPTKGLDSPLHMHGTPFQQSVWEALCEIPFGKTATYAQIAKRIGKPKSVRAVAQACGSNHIAVAIPCHRVVRTDGSLSGYRWGARRKAELLKRERKEC